MSLFVTAARKTGGGLKRLFNESFIGKTLDRLGAYLGRCVDRSLCVGAFSGYDRNTALVRRSFLYRLFVRWPAPLYRRLRRFCMRTFEQSLCRRAIRTASDYVFSISLHAWSTGLLTGGFVAALLPFVLYFSGSSDTLFTYGFFVGAACLLLGAAFQSGGQSISATLRKSFLLRPVLTELLSLRPAWFRRTEEPQNRFLLPVLLGLLLGAAVSFLPADLLVLGVGGLLAVLAIFCSTEAGVLLVAALMPFAPTMALAALCVLTFCSYFFRVLRGRRVWKNDALDLSVMAFALVLLYGVAISFDRRTSLQAAAVYLAFIAYYFVIVNTMGTRRWLWKLVMTFFISGSVCSLYGVYQSIVGVERSIIWTDRSMFSDISTRVFASFGNPNIFGEFLIVLLPLSVILAMRSRGWKQALALAALAATLLSLLNTYSRGAWLAAIASVAIFLLAVSRNFMKLGTAALCCVPFVPFLLPDSVINRFLSIGNLSDSSTAYRVNIWIGSLGLLQDYWPCGIGLGSKVYYDVYPRYALGGVAAAQHAHNFFLELFIELGLPGMLVFLTMMALLCSLVVTSCRSMRGRLSGDCLLALGCGLLAILIYGLAEHIWYNYSIILLFFMVMGMISALRREHRETGEREYGRRLADYGY